MILFDTRDADLAPGQQGGDQASGASPRSLRGIDLPPLSRCRPTTC